jgi:hypothetical protein
VVDRMIHTHKCTNLIRKNVHGGVVMGKIGVHWMHSSSKNNCTCMHGCVPDSCACVRNCVEKRHARMHVCVCDRGTCMHPCISNTCTCMFYYGMNMHAYVHTWGENNRALEEMLTSVKTFFFWRFWCFMDCDV